ncbi:SMODS domain-containing nucleotidyltransferase [Francisella philomiragia]|uniref:SMODS domain-containing nucleotidyltransferase n=1 Tax=Francisella philomiragia TaxID=28110 RepID=UPI0019059020|nr:nucleotidyltransferase [Francisella philomiragia]MBK2256671.1 nucleotidyltransferase [Francisella philomiragia]MBK2269329.1 nucleotidyltransferase [Francisella philomiragia]MBK2271306.1 nucleotidyltransferase [Francisella philomiragia]MBK2275086.1 nucleotidyltransferase [Francisella philomiragia]MBK2294680.1 nucleotidyltransferase [Francisella philomiragia]
MTISEKFQIFNKNIKISKDSQEKISSRYRQIIKRLNLDFWDSSSEIAHGIYVGSYGRDTDIHVSDVDVLFWLPYSTYVQYNGYETNGQSALLQAIKKSLQKTYGTSYIKSDGQVIGINFTDGISFEIVPCFVNKDDSFTYPDTNNGGSWKVTDPRPEIQEINDKNIAWNYNLKRLCRMARAWKDEWNVDIGGLLLDTLAYDFLKVWEYKNRSYTFYDWMMRDFFKYLKDQNENQYYWYSVGSRKKICSFNNFTYKSKRCYNIVLDAIEYENKSMPYTANIKWKEVFGNKFTG